MTIPKEQFAELQELWDRSHTLSANIFAGLPDCPDKKRYLKHLYALQSAIVGMMSAVKPEESNK